MQTNRIRSAVADPLARLIGPWRSVAVLIAGIAIAALVIVFSPEPTSGSEAGSNLPPDAESSLAAEALADNPGAGEAPAIVVFSRTGDELTAEDLAAAESVATELRLEFGDDVGGPIPAEDGLATIVTAPVPTGLPSDENTEIVDLIRSISTADLPSGLTAELTGAPAIFADLGEVFSGADTRLLAVTASVVAVLLLITYRSPWLWLVPLSVIGLGDRTAASVVEAASALSGIPIDGSVSGITSVLVFGAGTNYALLLIARYREELRRHAGRHDAMRSAVSAAAPAILASSSTVVLGLLALLLADSPFVERIGMAGAIGIALAVFFALVILPAAMVTAGRWLFWPFIPRYTDTDAAPSGWWHQLGTWVTSRPWPVLLVSLGILAAMALATLGLRTGLGQSEQFLDEPESIRAQSTLAESFGPGFASVTSIVTSTELAEEVSEAAQGVEGVESLLGITEFGSRAEVSILLDSEPASDASLDTVADIRLVLAQVDPDALVGGTDAEALDERKTATSDRMVIVPVVLAIVLLMLLLLLRSVVAAVLLAATTVLSYLSALGLGWLIFTNVFGWNATDVSTPLLAFIFLVALGVDYNIFLTARAREEYQRTGDPTGSIVTALTVTGGVITSAGILLAAVFTVLGVLPLVLLAQLGVIVSLGVLLDAVLVRSIVTPAMVAICGDRFWAWTPRVS